MCLNSSNTSEPYGPAFRKHSFHLTGPPRYIAAAISFLSVLRSLVIISSAVLFPKLRKATSRQILACIAAADIIASLANAIGAVVYLGFPGCTIQALFTVLGSLAFVLWTTCLGVFLYLSLALDRVVLAKRLR